MRGEEIENYSKRVWVFVAISVLLMAADSMGWSRSLRSLVQAGLAPVELGTWKVIKLVSLPGEGIRFYKNGVERIMDLEARLRERLVDHQELLRLRAENEELRKLMGVDLPADWKFAPAKVLGVNSEYMLIWAGKIDGVEVGMTVVTDKVLLGRVEEVTDRVSRVMLAGKSGSRVAVRVVETGSEGLATGVYGELQMQQILQDDPITPGQLVETAGNDELLPGLLIGKVREIRGESSQAYKTAILDELVRPYEVEYAFVVMEKGGRL